MAKNKKRKKSAPKSVKLKPAAYLFKYARTFPVHKCFINAEWKRSGLANVFVSRQKPNGQLIVGVYIVDIFCIGIKDTFYRIDISEQEYEQLLDAYSKINIASKMIPISAELAFNIVYGAAEYAEDIDLNPHKDFKTTVSILDDIEEVDYLEIDFGREGKPTYILRSGDKNSKKYYKLLLKNPGQGNFNFIENDNIGL